MTGGTLQWQSGGTIPANGIGYIDYGRPITADGTIGAAALRWLSDNACSGAFRIRIFRPSTFATNSFTMVGETPAFDITPGNLIQLVTFPAIAVAKGDLVGVTQTAAISGCGGATFSSSTAPGDVVYQISGNYTGGTLSGIQLRRGVRLDLVVSNAPLRLAGVIPVVGSVQGIGAFFRSSLQLTNPCPGGVDGMLVFHPASTASSSGDPTLNFHLDSFGSKSYADITAAFNRTGLGTLDVYTSACAPDATAYVYNDVGAAGTYGFSEDLLPPAAMFNVDTTFGTMPIPSDLTNFRMNVGIRTLNTATKIGGSVYDASGNYKGSIPERSYTPNFFEQVPLGAFLGTVAPPPGGMIFLFVAEGGPVVYYSSTIDNRTNDSSLKMVTAK